MTLPWNTSRPRRIGASILAGLAICASIPPWGWWPFAFVGIAVWVSLVSDVGWRSRALMGIGVGLGWFLPSTIWMMKFTQAAWPFGVAFWFPLVMALVSIVVRPSRPATSLAGALILAEWIRWHAPFGGVPLSVLAMSQGRGPLLPVARVVGSLGVSAAVVCLGAALGAALVADDRRAQVHAAIAAGAVVAVALVGVVAPDGRVVGRIDTAAVQGGGEQETRSDATDYDEVLGRHLDMARTIDEPVDLVVLPENIVNINGFYEGSIEQDLLRDLATDLDATVVAGVVEDEDDPDTFRNAVVSIGPDGEQTDRFDKVRRVPFGEYIPFRPFLESVAEDQIFQRDAIPGTGPAVLDTPAGQLGVVISWEVFFPRRTREAVREGSQMMLNPTNGASFWLTQVQTQQIASSQLRAVESGQWLVQAAPTGFSVVLDPAGNVVARAGIGEAAVLSETVELREGRTWASRVGATPALILAVLLLTFAWVGRLRDR